MDFKQELIGALSNSASGILMPQFDIKSHRGGNVGGFLISPSFVGKAQIERQKMVWDYLDKIFPREKTRKIDILITITPDEAQEDEDDE
ncbi:MAG: hypothetical protein NTX50_10285 [Candidatus Sumerlaeota bacterium]|nr:hypothetical protein [Candidatus Sumerlaeota bacterium]